MNFFVDSSVDLDHIQFIFLGRRFFLSTDVSIIYNKKEKQDRFVTHKNIISFFPQLKTKVVFFSFIFYYKKREEEH